LTLFLVVVLGFALAYTNGSNDVSKGIATLVGSGVTSYRRAILWGTLWTGTGGIAAAFLSHAMIQTFGSSLLAPGRHPSFSAAFATIAGATLWVALATIKRLPVSTTHAIVGAVAGVASLAYGTGGVNWSSLVGKIALPLLLSPLAALAFTAALLRIFRSPAPDMENDCVCAEINHPAAAFSGVAAMKSASLSHRNSTSRHANLVRDDLRASRSTTCIGSQAEPQASLGDSTILPRWRPS